MFYRRLPLPPPPCTLMYAFGSTPSPLSPPPSRAYVLYGWPHSQLGFILMRSTSTINNSQMDLQCTFHAPPSLDNNRCKMISS